MKENKWEISDDTKYSRYKVYFLVAPNGEILKEVRQNHDDTYSADGRRYINLTCAKMAAEKSV